MIFEGDTSVIRAIKEKKSLMEAREPHDHIDLLVITDGGLIKGAYSVGTGLALEELGLNDTFSSIVGISSGAPSVAYFLGGNVSTGASLIYEECCSKDFVHLWKFGNQVDTRYLIEVLKGKTGKPINVERILASRTRLYIGVADFQTARPVLIEPKTEQELLDAIHASILMPNLTAEEVFVNGVQYADGGYTKPHIIAHAVRTIPASHILILTNQNKGELQLPLYERFLNATVFRSRMSPALRRAAQDRKRERMLALDEIRTKSNVPIAVVWGDGSLTGMETDSLKIKEVVDRSRLWWTDLLSQA